MFVRLFQSSESLEKSLAGAISKEEKGRNGNKTKFMQKLSQQLPSCVIATRDSQFCKMLLRLFCFEQVKALKNFSEKLYTSKDKEEVEMKSNVWDLKMP